MRIKAKEQAQNSMYMIRPKCVSWWKLAGIVCNEGASLPWQERSQLHSFLLECHQAFSLEDREWGETSLVEMHIDTGDSSPRKQPVYHILFAVR